MTSEIAAQQYQGDNASMPDVSVRVTPPHPLGSRSRVNGAEMAELGAMLAAAGAERGAATALFHLLQDNTIQTFLRTMPDVLTKVQEWQQARLNRVMQAIKALPEAPVQQQGFLGRVMAPVQQGPQPSYVSRDQVLQVIAQAMVEPSQI